MPDFLTRQRSRMAARVGVVIGSSRRAIRILVFLTGRSVIMTAALGGFTGMVGMIQRQHAAAESGDHAEHHEPWEPTAHGDEETPIFRYGKPNLAPWTRRSR